ncbi:MAG TPA: hypothetical protein VH583_10060 [Vicinamibacterales bacterium]|jgi:hypothetical protein
MNSSSFAGWIAHIAFWILLACGRATDELTWKGVSLFLLLWFAGLFGLRHAPYEPMRAMFSSFVAILDIALMFVVSKGDVRLT